jgi:hypothetical protein
LALEKHSGLADAVDSNAALRHGVSHSDVLRSYLGLLSLGKSDFDAIENVRSWQRGASMRPQVFAAENRKVLNLPYEWHLIKPQCEGAEGTNA